MATQAIRLARLITPIYAAKVNTQLVYPATSVIVKPNELHSALARPLQSSYYEPDRPPVYYAAQLSYGIIMGHPFLDGNKRTAFFLAHQYLRMFESPGFTGTGMNTLSVEEVGALAEKFIAVAKGELEADQLAREATQHDS